MMAAHQPLPGAVVRPTPRGVEAPKHVPVFARTCRGSRGQTSNALANGTGSDARQAIQAHNVCVLHPAYLCQLPPLKG